MIIRWLGAFGKGHNLSQSLAWELSNAREVAAEPLAAGLISRIPHAQIGLVVSPNAVIRVFEGDVWSKVGDDGKLFSTRRAGGEFLKSRHSEAFCKPVYVAIVCKAHPSRMSKVVQEALQKQELPIFYISNGKKRRIFL